MAICNVPPREIQIIHADGVAFYNQIVPLPMSLLIIQARLTNKYYRHPHAAHNDVKLIVANAKLFNGADSSIARTARGQSRSQGT